MLYTIISRIPVFVNDKTSKKYAKIFMIGAICYIIIHYLLFAFCKGDLAGKLKNYIYYIIIVDAGIAYLLDKLLNITDEEDNSHFVKKINKTTEESETKKKHENSDMKKQNKNEKPEKNIEHEEHDDAECKNGICKPRKKINDKNITETSTSKKQKTTSEKDTEIPEYKI
jgi:hypothetical protein